MNIGNIKRIGEHKKILIVAISVLIGWFSIQECQAKISLEGDIYIGFVVFEASPHISTICGDDVSLGKCYPLLRKAVHQGKIKTVVTNEKYCLELYRNGVPVKGHCTKTKTGVFTMKVKRSDLYLSAFCVRVPKSWGGIAFQKVHPNNDRNVMCSPDFGPALFDQKYGRDAQHAIMVPVVKP